MTEPKILANGWESITPADAGWTYVSFAVHTLQAGDSLTLPIDGQERALVPLSGTADVAADGQRWQLGGRQTVWVTASICRWTPKLR